MLIMNCLCVCVLALMFWREIVIFVVHGFCSCEWNRIKNLNSFTIITCGIAVVHQCFDAVVWLNFLSSMKAILILKGLHTAYVPHMFFIWGKMGRVRLIPLYQSCSSQLLIRGWEMQQFIYGVMVKKFSTILMWYDS